MKRTLSAIAVVCLCYSSYSQPFKIATGEPLHSIQQELPVKGRNGILIKQKLSFGTYHTTKVRRSAIRKWTGTTGFPGMIWTEHMEGRQSIHFSLSDDTRTSDAMAVSNVIANDLLISSADRQKRIPGAILPLFRQSDLAQNNYSVAIVTQEGDEPWELYLDNIQAQVRRKEAAGYIVRGDDYYTIEPVWQVEKKNGKIADFPFGSSGFEIKDTNGQVLAAVSLIDNGAVYLGPGTEEEKFLFANACAALLLQSQIND